ncbi:MAG: ADP-ribosylglycohydrolase family protein [Dehalococcoidales bacterium]|nr:ADP-ribosylglycohydrolase family protein [Dehalococcoidales bacterium]
MIDNTQTFNNLMAQGKIRVHDDYLLHTNPGPLSPDFNFDKVEGMLLGAAIGDSLGAASESLTPSERRKRHGEIKDYIPYKRSKNKPLGAPTDDTQLTFRTLKQLIKDGGLIPDNLANMFCKHHISGIGGTTKEFIRNYKDRHKTWYDSGPDSLGNGVLMRISPVVIPYLRNPSHSMYIDAVLDAVITHNSFANTATSATFTHIFWKLLSLKHPPDMRWWIDTYCEAAEKLEGNTTYINHGEPLWQFTYKKVNDAIRRNLSTLQACNEWGSGANLFETVPSVIYILAKHSQNTEEAIIRAVNDTKDNDTVAAIVGAAVGALNSLSSIPSRWIKNLTGRINGDDDGEVFKLILEAKRKFWLVAD